MRTCIRTAFAVAVAATALAVAAGGASALTMSIAPAGNFRATSLGVVEVAGAGITVRCNMTFNGTFPASFVIFEGARMGEMTGHTPEGCVGGRSGGILELPWEIIFTRLTVTGLEGFIRGISLLYDLTLGGTVTSCLYRGDIAFLLGIAATLTRLLTFIRNTVSKEVRSPAACPAAVVFTGSFGITQQTITLR